MEGLYSDLKPLIPTASRVLVSRCAQLRYIHFGSASGSGLGHIVGLEPTKTATSHGACICVCRGA